MTPETVQFFDSLEPGLAVGTYTIKVDHAVVGVKGAPSPSARQTFTVQGPRFTLDPTEIHGFYPPANGVGPFMETFPHVVLSTRMLPWERELTVETTVAGTKQTAQVPWLALLVFDAAELGAPGPPSKNGDPPTGPTRAVGMNVAALLAAGDGTVAVPAPKDPVSADEMKLACQTLQIPTSLFTSVAPRADELHYLAHLRLIQAADARDAEDAGWYALVVANRTPAPGSTGVAHLVSLEGHEALLAGGTAKASVRLVSLASWSFTESTPVDGTTPTTTSFAAVASALARPRTGERGDLALGLPYDASRADRKPPATDADGRVADRLAAGYVPIRYHLPTGQDTFAWYRGPLAARPTAAVVSEARPFASSSAALVYDPATGLFDVSLAAAWEIGRALALADRKFATELVRFRRSVHRLADRILGGLQSEHVDTSDGNLQKIATSGLIQQRFLDHLKDGLATHVAKLSRSAPPPAAPSRAATSEPPDPVEAVKKLLDDHPDLDRAITGEVAADLQPLADWLADLTHLHLVPYAYLVPHPELLPDESIRFFDVDVNWTGALFDGALSVGVQSSRDTWFQALARRIVAGAWQRVEHASAASGLLLRSSLLSGWPGLTLHASASGQVLDPVRSERLAPNLLLCLFDTVPDQVRLRAPRQGLHFAVEMIPAADRTWRDDAKRVLDVGAVAGRLGAAGAGQYALRMLAAPDQLTFGRKP